MRNFKKALSLCLVLVMLCSVMSISAFATDTYDVTIYLERIYRDSNNLVTSHYSLNSGNAVVVTVDSGSSLKAAIIKACDENDTIMCDPVWTTDGQYLTSLDVHDVTYASEDHFYQNTPTEGKTTYVGKSWMYFNDSPSNIPLTTYVYPSVSLLNATVTSNVTITLSYEDQTFVW